MNFVFKPYFVDYKPIGHAAGRAGRGSGENMKKPNVIANRISRLMKSATVLIVKWRKNHNQTKV